MPTKKNISKKDMEKEEYITDREKQDRIYDLKQALKIYNEACLKLDKISSPMDEIIGNILKLQQYCKRTPSLRSVYLSQKLSIEPLVELLLRSKNQLFEFKRISERAKRGLGDIETDIINPKLLR